MTDIATRLDPATLDGDWLLGAAGDLDKDAGLRTAVIISLFSDRTAGVDDPLPDPRDSDRRGWWGDLNLDGAAPDPIGSRLWLLSRAKSTEETRRRAEIYVREALAWMRADGVAAVIDVTSEWQGFARERLAIGITIRRRDANGAATDVRFDVPWSVEAAR